MKINGSWDSVLREERFKMNDYLGAQIVLTRRDPRDVVLSICDTVGLKGFLKARYVPQLYGAGI